MAKVQVCNVVVENNPAPFNHPFLFKITFECIEELQDDLEWKMIYVGSAESEEYDQILDNIFVGPIPEGKHMFPFEAPSPKQNEIPEGDAIGVTVVLLTCCYRGQEFLRIGYFVNNDYNDPELKENPPAKPDFDKVVRNILATAPRVTRFKINWGDEEGVATVTDPDVGPSLFSENSQSSFATVEDSCASFMNDSNTGFESSQASNCDVSIMDM